MGEQVEFQLPGGSLSLFIERPSSVPAPVVVVLHEVFGVNDDLRATCRELAERGYIAICPDLFFRLAPGFSLSSWTEADMPRIQSLYQAFDRGQAAEDVAGVIEYARQMDGSTGRVGLLGYCMGGLMTFLTAARFGADASVVYYPGQAELYLDEAANVGTPMIVHLAEEDEYISKDAQRDIKTAFASNRNVQLFSYPGCNHAFARHSGDHYDAEAAHLANGRTWTFLDEHLK